ncbi:MAG TPA: metallophosphoesterase [Methanomassiliicoccales archaeon]|nr:metallophosphoesterase [Methanomassiliicoccales archaeon]
MKDLEIIPGLLISNDLCALLPTESTAVIADLHLGYESVLEDSGLHLPRMQTERMKETLTRIIERHSPKRFIILGDLKHEFSRNLAQEWSEVRALLSLLQDQGDVIVVRGNHDNYLATIASKLGVTMKDKCEVGGVHFVHGHEDCDDRPLVIGHEHPSVRLYDDIGACVKMPCFVHVPQERIVVMPAFSPLARGTDFTGISSEGTMSPVLQRGDLSGAVAYACSEIGLLPLGLLSRLPRTRRR